MSARVVDVERRLLSIEASAAYLSVSVRTMKQLLADGAVLTVSIGARKLIDRRDLDSYVEGLKREA